MTKFGPSGVRREAIAALDTTVEDAAPDGKTSP
jgi:hypothetical protein